MNKVRVVSLACDTPTGPPLHPYQILSNYLKQYGISGLHKISASGEILYKKDRVVSLACYMPTGPPLHPYQILSNYFKQYGSYGLHKILASGRYLYNKDSESCLSCMRHTYWTPSSFLLNITKIHLRVSKTWSAQG